MSMPRAIRHINETRALDALLKRGPMSRADLARDLGVTRATASNIVQSLAHSGCIEERTEAYAEHRSRTGRPSMLIRLRPDHAIFLGVDIAIDHISFAALDMNLKLVASERFQFDSANEGYLSVLKLASSGISSLMSGLQSLDSVKGLCITVPGPVYFDGNVVHAPLLGWNNAPVRKSIRDIIPGIESIKVDNVASAFAIADMANNNRSEKLNAIYVLIEDCVGVCIVNNGRKLRGHFAYVGEIGHIIFGQIGYGAQTSPRGSLESLITRSALLCRHRSHGGSAGSIAEFLRALAQEEPAARLTLSHWAGCLGRGLATLTSILNPERIILGGDIASVLPLANTEVMTCLKENVFDPSTMPVIEISSMGNEAPAIGAAIMQHKEFFSLDSELTFGFSTS